MERYPTKRLKRMTTKAVGQASDLKVDKEGYRFWLSRCSVEDGEPFNNTVYVEQKIDDAWRIVDFYDGDNP